MVSWREIGPPHRLPGPPVRCRPRQVGCRERSLRLQGSSPPRAGNHFVPLILELMMCPRPRAIATALNAHCLSDSVQPGGEDDLLLADPQNGHLSSPRSSSGPSPPRGRSRARSRRIADTAREVRLARLDDLRMQPGVESCDRMTIVGSLTAPRSPFNRCYDSCPAWPRPDEARPDGVHLGAHQRTSRPRSGSPKAALDGGGDVYLPPYLTTRRRGWRTSACRPSPIAGP